MATLFINEYADLARDAMGNVIAAPLEPAHAAQQVTVGTEADSAALNAKTAFVEIYTDTAAHIVFGLTPTAATATHMKLAANERIFRGVPTGEALKISVIAAV